MSERILLVDDEQAILFAMRDYFTAYGYEVDCSREVEEAEALLAELNRIIQNDRYPLSRRIRLLRYIRAKLPGAPRLPPATPPPRTGRPRRA